MKTLVSNNKGSKSEMKAVQVNKKKKDQKPVRIQTASQDTIAETIAFVIKGQLTPIKPTPLPEAKVQKNVIKRLQKDKVNRSRQNKPQEVSAVGKTTVDSRTKGDVKVAIEEQTTKTGGGKVLPKSAENHQKKSTSKTHKKEDLDSSIQKIIKKYAKKFNIKRSTKILQSKQSVKKSKPANPTDVTESQKLIVPESISGNRRNVKRTVMKNPEKDISEQPSKDCREKQNQNDPKLLQPKIKEEKTENIFQINVKSEPGEVTESEKQAVEETVIVDETNIKVELTDEPKEVTSKIDFSDKEVNTLKKQAVKAKKLRLLKKKSLVSKETQKRMEDKRRAKLIQFWNSPKRHRVASLNALAKVHCLYENESKAAFEKITENSFIKKEPLGVFPHSKNIIQTPSSDSSDSDSEEQLPRRTLRNVPGLNSVGKHWDMYDCLSSDNSDIEIYRAPKKTVRVKKEVITKKQEKPKKDHAEEKDKKRKAGQEVLMDLKDMVVKKRMASLNASAILAASYSSDKKSKSNRATESSSYDSDSSAEEYFAAVEHIDLTKDPKEEIKQEEDRSLVEVHTTPNKKVAVILNQDTDVTITGVYVNSTTRSTHHEGYCSIAGMQYRISATSHTQTAATTLATETLLQSASSSDNAHSDAQSCSSKSYTPLDALSNMQPPPGPGIHTTLPPHPGMPCQVGSPSHRQHPPTSAFTSPHHGPVGLSQVPPGQAPPPDPHGGYVRGYYQPAGPLISVSHSHGQPPLQQPPLPKSVPLSDASPTSLSSSTHQAQGPPAAPSSTNGDSSDNEVIITSVTAGRKDPPPPTSHPTSTPYRYPQFSQYPSYACPTQYHYQTPPPPQTPPYPHHEMCYPTGPPAGYLRHTKYSPSPTGPFHRYPYYGGNELYPPSSVPPSQATQQMVTAAPVSAAGSYPAGTNIPPPPPAIMEPYPPPPAPPTLVDAYQASPHYYPSAYSLPPTCYSHSPTRAIQYINATYQHCPCPLNTCPKNGHTGPLTGESKRSNISKDSKPLPPVALALPLEPVSATGPPSPARGSAGMPSGDMPPPPSPAGASYQQQPTPKQESNPVEVFEQCKVEKRKARVGKANVRNNIMHNTMLLMCNPGQNYVKREIESPNEKEGLQKDCEEVKESLEEPLVSNEEVNGEGNPIEECGKTEPEEVEKIVEKEVIIEEPLPPCVATVAENVKVKNMKRKQSQSRECIPETSPPAKKKKVSSYKDFIRKHTACFKINNGKKKLVSKTSRTQLPKIKLNGKNKLSATKEQTNNRRMKGGRISLKKTKTEKGQRARQTADKILDNLIAKNAVDKTIDAVIKSRKQVKVDCENKKSGVKTSKTEKRVKRRKSTSKCKAEGELDVKVSRKANALPKWSNGWMWEGEPYEGKVFINSDETTLVRKCYPSMRHKEGDLIRPGDCVLLKAGPRKNDLPYVAKIAALWENSDDGEMMMSLLWYYRPEHTEQGRVLTDQPDEVFASRHKDSNSVACIDDKCYVLTFNEYCRYKKNFKRVEEGVEERPRLVPLPDPYPRMHKQPPSGNIFPDMVFFCRKVYDFRQKRIVKNPT
ncbi:uncharacterized protein Hers [Euwallacea similis]|uniref:uncharacterized protein Hers n=1 Tax=Euwallacea similis TaxID=1736056 RepID=UPI00344BFC96